MRRWTSHTGNSPLWYSTSSTPNSVVPSPKRAMLAREWRSTASNARASTIHSLRGVGEGGDGFISLQEPWLQGKCSTLVDIEYLDFEIHCPSAWEVSNVGRSGTVGFAADARGGVSGPRGAEVGGRVRRPGLCGRHRVHREHRIPPGAALDGARRRRGVGRWVAVCAGVVDPARRVAGARDYGGRDRQGAWAQGLLQPERRVRVQPGADHRRPGCGGARAGGPLARPLAVAVAVASGVTPERGLFTAIVAGFLISALGGSRVQIGGPTGAFVVIVYAIVQRHGVEGLAAATMMAGVILVIFGVVRLGGAIKFIPYPVTIGFTSGIALIIFSSQVKDFLGLRMGAVPADFVGKWQAIGAHLDTIDPWALLVGLTALAIIVGWPLVNRRVPSPFVALIATTAMVQLLHFPVETIGSRFGAINAALPAPALPAVTPQQLPGLLAPAFTIALLGAIESLLSAVVADGMIGGRHRSNMELVAQGVANIVTPLFGGIPATGAIARTATNVKNGGRTPVAGMVHSVTLLLITLFFGRWAGLIPMATLAAILLVVAYSMSEWRT